MINKMIKKPLMLIKNYYLDRRAAYYLKIISEKKHDKVKPLKVGFIVFEPETWDKLQPVYEEMLIDKDFEPLLIVLPSFDTKLCLSDEYGYEKEFFEKKYRNIQFAYDDEKKLIDISRLDLDYVFYQDPYDAHYPNGLKTKDLVRFVKICLIPYGYTLSCNFLEMIKRNSFYKNVYFNFADSKAYGEIIENTCRKNIKNGLQSVQYCGYPALEKYLKWNNYNGDGSITWAPRWSFDDIIGGSNFLKYKDHFLSLRKIFPEEKILMRPHPMLFSNLVSTKKMTVEEKEFYLKNLRDNDIEINDRGAIDGVLNHTKLLITDFSSIIISFFATGRPMIYCESIFVPTQEFKEILQYVYIAHSWDEVLYYTEEILKGNDYLREARMNYINNGNFEIHKTASLKILEKLKNKGGI